MKRIPITGKVQDRLRASFGPDANLDGFVAYECIALNTLPVRKASGLYKGARNSLSLLSEIAAAINAESHPIQVQHDTSEQPFGRVFHAEVVGDELRSMFVVDATNHPDLPSKIDSGTIDQVSVNLLPKRLTCSGCGFDYLASGNELALWTLTCDEGHTIGEDGVFVHVDGLNQFFELSLVGKGGATGARIVGPTDSQLLKNDQFRLAASANPGLHALCLTPTPKEPSTTMNAEQMAAFQAAVAGQATAAAQLAAVQGQVTEVTAQLTASQAQLAEANTALAAAQAASAASEANAAAAAAALTALQAHAKKVVVAVGKPDTAIPDSVDAVLALIEEHSAAFAAIIPVGGITATQQTNDKAPANRNSAFRAPQ